MSARNRRVVVTGGNGFIGRHLIEKLVALGDDVLNISRTSPFEQYNRESYQSKVLDLSHANDVMHAIKEFNPETIFHLASRADAKESYEHSINSANDNLVGTINLLEAFSKSSNAKSFIYGDSVKVYGNSPPPYRNDSQTKPNSAYAISKLAGWSFCELYSCRNAFNCISVRPTLVFGERQPMNIIQFVIESILSGRKEITLMGGNQTRAPLYIEDALNAYLHAELIAEESNLETMIISGDTELSIASLTQMIATLMNSNISIVEQAEKLRETEIIRSYVDLDQTYKNFNWQPKYTLEEGLRATIKHLTLGTSTPIGAKIIKLNAVTSKS
jgi:UDP-glucose 4-epimerase